MIGYKFFAFLGPILLTVRTRGTGDGCFEVLTAQTGDALGEIAITASRNWAEHKAEIPMFSAVSPLYLRYRGKGHIDLLDFSIHGADEETQN